jgi:hypothetical protein
MSRGLLRVRKAFRADIQVTEQVPLGWHIPHLVRLKPIDQSPVGGFKWSSQHLDGSCDEHSKAALGSFWAGALVLTGSTAGGRPRGAAAILGSDCGRHGE